jgi:hypothetical protein
MAESLNKGLKFFMHCGLFQRKEWCVGGGWRRPGYMQRPPFGPGFGYGAPHPQMGFPPRPGMLPMGMGPPPMGMVPPPQMGMGMPPPGQFMPPRGPPMHMVAGPRPQVVPMAPQGGAPSAGPLVSVAPLFPIASTAPPALAPALAPQPAPGAPAPLFPIASEWRPLLCMQDSVQERA